MVPEPDNAQPSDNLLGKYGLPEDLNTGFFDSTPLKETLFDRLVNGPESPFSRLCLSNGFPSQSELLEYHLQEGVQLRHKLERVYRRLLHGHIDQREPRDLVLARHPDCLGRDLMVSEDRIVFLMDLSLRSKIVESAVGRVSCDITASRGKIALAPWGEVMMIEAVIQEDKPIKVSMRPIFSSERFSFPGVMKSILAEISSKTPKPDVLKTIYEESLASALSKLGRPKSEADEARVNFTSIIGNELVVRLAGNYFEIKFGATLEVEPNSIGQLYCVIVKDGVPLGQSRSLTAFLLTDSIPLLPIKKSDSILPTLKLPPAE